MANGTMTITVDADTGKAWNAASPAQRKRLQVQLKTWLNDRALPRKQAPHLSRKESELLLKINQDLSAQHRQRMAELTDKMEFASITKAEHAEMMRLVEEAEALAVTRLEAVIELAKYRKIPPDQMLRQLGMEPGRHAR
jgi:hypothetical protein